MLLPDPGREVAHAPPSAGYLPADWLTGSGINFFYYEYLRVMGMPC